MKVFLFLFKEGPEKSFRVTDDGEADGVCEVVVPTEGGIGSDEVQQVLADPGIGDGLNQSKGRRLANHGVASGIARTTEVELDGFRGLLGYGWLQLLFFYAAGAEAMSDSGGLDRVDLTVRGCGHEMKAGAG